MKDSAKYVGTPQSIAIRIPDCSVTTHLIDLVSGQGALIPAPLASVGCPLTAQGADVGSATSTQLFWAAAGVKDRETAALSSFSCWVLAHHLSSPFFLRAVRMIACSEWFLGSEKSYTE